MTRCSACGGRLGRTAVYCPACSTPRGPTAISPTEFELGDADPQDADSGVRFERPPFALGRVIAAIVGLVGAAVAASVVLRSGDDGNVANTSTTIPTATMPDTTATTTAAPIAARDEVTTTTSSPVVQLGTGPLLGEPTGLGLLLSGNQLVVVDLDRATLTPVRSFGRYVVDGRLTPVGLAYGSPNGGYFLLEPGASVPRRLGEGGTYLGEGPAGRAWFELYNATPNGRYVHIDAPGAAPLPADLPDGVTFAYPDGAGGWITEAGGSVYHLRADGGVVRIATADLLGASDGYALARSCDDELRCHYVVVDVATGTSRAGPAAPGGPWNGQTKLSPDGSWILALEGPPGPGQGGRLVALGFDGTRVELGPALAGCIARYCTGAPAWVPSGSWLLWIFDATTIAAWRPRLDEPLLVKLPAGAVDGSLLSMQGVSVGTAEQLAAIAAHASLIAPG